jgi:hypothetical protein
MKAARTFAFLLGAGTLLSGCAALAPKPKPAPAIAINQDPYPSTYARYPAATTVIRNATVLDGEGGQIANGTVVLADGVIPRGRRRSTAPASS